jgi:hypothetical protein
MHEGRCRCGHLDAKIDRYIAVPHQTQHEFKRRRIGVAGGRAKHGVGQSGLFVGRATLTTAASFAGF